MVCISSSSPYYNTNNYYRADCSVDKDYLQAREPKAIPKSTPGSNQAGCTELDKPAASSKLPIVETKSPTRYDHSNEHVLTETSSPLARILISQNKLLADLLREEKDRVISSFGRKPPSGVTWLQLFYKDEAVLSVWNRQKAIQEEIRQERLRYRRPAQAEVFP